MGKIPIEQLSEETLAQLINDYQNLESGLTVKDIIEKYDIDVLPGVLGKKLPPKKTNEICPYCNTTMVAKIRNRHSTDSPKCVICGHKVSEFAWVKCHCKNCQLAESQLNEKKKQIIADYYAKGRTQRLLSELCLKDQYYLIELAMVSGGRVNKIDSRQIRDFPKYRKVIEEFCFLKILSVSAESDISAFCMDDDFPAKYNPEKVIYDVNVIISEEEIDAINNRAYFTSLDCKAEKWKLLLEIMHQDVLERFKDMLSERGLGHEIYTECEKSFMDLYYELSYAQIISLCFQVARYALDKVQTGQMKRYNVPKLALKLVVTFYEKRKQNGWRTANSDISYAGGELIFYIKWVLGKESSILNEVITIDMM